MFFISNLCIVCLTYKNLNTVLIKDNDGIVIKNKLQYCLPEIVDYHLDIPEYVCLNCISKLHCFYKFKQWCLENNKKLRNYSQTSTETDKHLSVSFTDTKYQNKLQAVSKDQTLSIAGSDESPTGEKKDSGTNIKAAETVFKNNKELHPLFDDEKDIIVKEECLTSEDNTDIEYYHNFLETIKYESYPSDSNVSVSDPKNVHENSEDINSSSEMFFNSILCILCFSYENLKTVFIEDYENKLKFCLPEIVDSHLDAPEYICINCISKLEYFHKFKQCCLKRNRYLKNYVQKLISAGETYQYLSVRLTDIKFQNKFEAENKHQTLLIVGGDDELRTEEKEDYASCNKELVIKKGISCADVSNIKDSLLLFDDEKDEIVKEERLASEDKDDIEYYHKFVDSIKHESISSDSNVSVSNNEDVHEDSEVSSNSNENNSTEPEQNKVKVKNNVKKTNNYQCDNCSKEFINKRLLENHLKAHAGFKAFSCTMCNKKFVRKSDVILHERNHNNIKNFECSICHKKFTQKGNLNKHEKIHIGVKNFECSVCNKRFNRKDYLNSHERIHTGVKNYECSVCNKKFSRKAHLNSHKRIHTGVKNFECSVCNKKFSQKAYLNSHERIHTGVKNFKCSVCNKKFSRKDYLNSHQRIHTGVKNFECSICNKKFGHKSSLNLHKRIHTCVKNFECSVCNKKFGHKSSLNLHKRIHTGVKNFECSVCNKKFGHKSSLNLHQRIHTGVKNFECSVCNKKFTQKCNLNIHEKIHTGVKNFECSVCNKKFTQKCNLNIHEKIHTGVKNFECSVCNKKFAHKPSLKLHERIHSDVKM